MPLPAETPGVGFISKRVNLIPDQQDSAELPRVSSGDPQCLFVGDKIGHLAVIDRDGRQTLIRTRERVAFIITGQLQAVMDESLAG